MKNIFLVLPFLLVFIGCSASIGKSYYVKEIISHYPQVDDNTETEVVVWENGRDGHVRSILCAFPPDIILDGSNETGWRGIERIKIGKKYKTYSYYGSVSYLCEVVE